MSKKKCVIFGMGSFSELVAFYLSRDSEYDVTHFCCTEPQVADFSGRPVISVDDVVEKLSPEEYEVFVAIGYRKMNTLRKHFCTYFKSKGYKLLSYVSSKATLIDPDMYIGENVFIFEGNNIQPFVEIGDGNILWSGNHVGHHSVIGNYNFLASHVVISGHVVVGDQCFFGVNSTVIDSISIADQSLIGPNALVQKSTSIGDVHLGIRAKLMNKDSNYFLA